MNCCGSHEKSRPREEAHSGEESHGKESPQPEKKAGFKEYLLIALVLGLLVFAVVEAVQIRALSARPASQPAQSGGETYEQMMARMHPEQSSQGGMVGGC
ncbi:hypothetical protein HYY74_04875 [Candidatus Woesearchaeota archaeon]|nr:hypothetical protein [Candidatus Woesearchaeota archaeon]